MENKEALKKKVIDFLATINEDNFSSSYDQLLDILLSEGLFKSNKSLVINILKEVDNTLELDKYQEEVFLEISSRIEGLSSEAKNVQWK